MPQISNIAVNGNPKVGQTRITPPALTTSLTFSDPQLFGCLGRAMALSGAPTSVVQGLTNTFAALLNTLVDPSQTDLTLLTDVEYLSDNLRTALSGFVGAGIADLYMTNIGYAFRCNGRELVHTGSVFDLAYDGGPLGGADIVAVEAKGSLQPGGTPAHVRNTTRKGYANQVDPHVGTIVGTPPVSSIVHGYAIGTGSELKRAVPCHVHVEETTWTAALPGSPPPPPPSPAGGTATSRQPNGNLAVHNYRGVFRLMGGGGILDVIESSLAGDWRAARSGPAEQLKMVSWRGSDYVVVAAAVQGVLTTPTAAFGLRRDVAEAFLNGMTTCIVNGAIPTRFPRELPVRALDGSLGLGRRDGGAEFPDGLAYFGTQLPVSAHSDLAWHPEKGIY